MSAGIQFDSLGAPANFFEEVMLATPGDTRLQMCIQCGTCAGSCPSGEDMQHSPRQLFAMIRAGMREEVLNSTTPWYCVSCYFCTVRCPQDVSITGIMYTLKSMAIKAGKYEKKKAGADLSQSFVNFVENYGRSFELGLATRNFLQHSPVELFRMATMGLGMLSRERLDLTPDKIKNIDQLQAILNKAKEIEGVAA
ncbi:MAG: 4Fe-4S dicluster domain-containing protein [Candidatus Promineifilaceae bacterium]|nr:4Fe-4S dicluster domain-containing protein [Candidatus Promineifilaceae bacterium]